MITDHWGKEIAEAYLGESVQVVRQGFTAEIYFLAPKVGWKLTAVIGMHIRNVRKSLLRAQTWRQMVLPSAEIRHFGLLPEAVGILAILSMLSVREIAST